VRIAYPADLQICASVAWIVRILQVVSYPVAYPVAKLLDRILGDHSSHVLFKRSELGTLINLHDEQKKGPLEKDEANVIRGALEFGNKKAKDIMTNIEHICMLYVCACSVWLIVHDVMNYSKFRICTYLTLFIFAACFHASAHTPTRTLPREIDRILDMNTLAEILGMGHSRIPVFHKSRHNVKGLLLVKRLIVCNPDDNRPVYHFVHRKPIVYV
jgi:metal transporter CNNM